MIRFETPFALSLGAGDFEDLENRYHWTGWKRRHWPANILRPGLRLYGFDCRRRALSVLLEVTLGGAFRYRTMREFARMVEQLTEWRPDPGDPHFRRIPSAPRGREDADNTGIALRWRVIKRVSIPISGRFPRLGWLKLDPSARSTGDIDPAEEFIEGGRQIRQHMRRERNPVLRARARDLWRLRLGRLKCIACGFSFEQRYGPLGADFIEMHHEFPFSATSGRAVVRPDQLKPLCANCHRMVHREHPILTIRKLKVAMSRRRRK
jgi:5-methylcytosine-specific restriction protein A